MTTSILPRPRNLNAIKTAVRQIASTGAKAAGSDTSIASTATDTQEKSATVEPRSVNFALSNTRRLLGDAYRTVFTPLTRLSAAHFIGMRFNPMVSANLRAQISWNNCASAVEQAKQAPAYARFLAEQGIETPTTWSEVPVTSKSNYIKKCNNILERACGGRLADSNITFDSTSGTTGEPVTWARGLHERAAVGRLIEFATEVQFHNQAVTVIDAFDMGQWATGMTIARAMPARAKVFTPGRDVNKVLGNLKVLGPDENYVLMGYPPFLEQLVRQAEAQNVNLHAYKITAVVGGEGLSEATRDMLSQPQGPFVRVISSYGASDLDINVGIETDFEVDVRRAMADNSDFAMALYGKHIPSRFHGAVPMVFHYDPQNYFIESDERGHLLFTCTRNDRVEPRIRYDLGDIGTVLPVEALLDAAKTHGVNLPKPRTNLPMLLVWGRDESVSFGGTKVTPAHLLQAIQRVPALASQVGRYAFHQKDAGRLAMLVEMTGHGVADEAAARALQQALCDVSPDYREAAAHLPASEQPPVTFYPVGQSPMAKIPGVKHTYIMRGALPADT